MGSAAAELHRLSRNLNRADRSAVFHNLRQIARSAAVIHENLSALPGDAKAAGEELQPYLDRAKAALHRVKTALHGLKQQLRRQRLEPQRIEQLT
jgi:hypothetical protein